MQQLQGCSNPHPTHLVLVHERASSPAHPRSATHPPTSATTFCLYKNAGHQLTAGTPFPPSATHLLLVHECVRVSLPLHRRVQAGAHVVPLHHIVHHPHCSR